MAGQSKVLNETREVSQLQKKTSVFVTLLIQSIKTQRRDIKNISCYLPPWRHIVTSFVQSERDRRMYENICGFPSDKLAPSCDHCTHYVKYSLVTTRQNGLQETGQQKDYISYSKCRLLLT
jgi:hypothetical protein